MNELYLMVTIAPRGSARQYLPLSSRPSVTVTLTALGAGTAGMRLLELARDKTSG